MNDLQALADTISRLPGIGPRQAKRIAYFLLSEQKGVGQQLANVLTEVKNRKTVCSDCFGLYFDQGEKCSICRDPGRDREILMVLENDIDKESVDRSRVFNGLYFILGGSIPVNESRPETQGLRTAELLTRLSSGSITELILAFNYTPQGEHTERLLFKYLQDNSPRTDLKITSLGRGFSTGTELEYSDIDTFKYALNNRR